MLLAPRTDGDGVNGYRHAHEWRDTMSKPWTRFMDMHSGGSVKAPPYEYIYIEAPEAEAREYFAGRFSNPDDVACSCCGENYSVYESDSLETATEFERTWPPSKGECSLDEYLARPDILVICSNELVTT